MIKITAISKDFGDHIGTHVDGDINGRGDVLIYEMAHILEEFHKIKDGEILTEAMGLMLDKLLEERRADD